MDKISVVPAVALTMVSYVSSYQLVYI